MLFNNVFVTRAHFCIYLKHGLVGYSDFKKLVMVKLAFDITTLKYEFVNGLKHALDNLETRNISVEQFRSYPLENFTFSFVILKRSPLCSRHVLEEF